ncbi:hypothetical protein F5Y08DRAFT_339011 [Xylaria arbuscula]|nr:hypothetical protein F5Y08DRAFT_339011 [Xylaria arbuscula]
MAASSPPMYSIRRHQPGDMGLIIHQHAILYEQSVGWGPSFEADVARTTLDFLDNFDSDLERVFIVESAETSKFLGSAAVFKHRKEVSTAQLRLLLVDPTVRGAGLGAKLIDECVRFA